MQWLMLTLVALLFVALTPGVLVTLPPGSSKLVVAATHGFLFAILYYLTHAVVYGGKDEACNCKYGSCGTDGKCQSCDEGYEMEDGQCYEQG